MTNSLGGLRAYFRPWARDLVDVASTAGLNPRVTSTLRSHTYQARLYRDYLAGRNPYPVAPPGSSAHELGLAFDMVTAPMSALAELGAVWEEWGGVWGGRFGDEVHFEFPGASQHAAGSAVTHPEDAPWRQTAANIAVGFLPGPAGVIASLNPQPTLVADAVPWWDDPKGVLHGLGRVFCDPLGC